MRAGALHHALPVLGLGLALGACAGVFTRAEQIPPVDTAALTATHQERAAALEREGDLRRALQEWTIALTITPDDGRAAARRAALEKRIEQTVARRLQEGRDALRGGDHLEARRRFLEALALDPANQPAFEALRIEIQGVGFFTHTVREGETLGSLAELYYGNPARSEIIAKANRLPASPRLATGVTLRIPEVPGLLATPPQQDPSPGTRPDTTPVYLEALERFERGEYVIALAGVEGLLAVDPKNTDGIELKKAILYEWGRHQFDLTQYAASHRTLMELATLEPDYEDAASLLREARSHLVQRHYNQGIRLFREERLAEAIAEWRQVLHYDPLHADAQRAIERAERLLQGLEERKKP